MLDNLTARLSRVVKTLKGEARLTEVAKQAGFSRVRRAAETPFNLVLEAKV